MLLGLLKYRFFLLLLCPLWTTCRKCRSASCLVSREAFPCPEGSYRDIKSSQCRECSRCLGLNNFCYTRICNGTVNAKCDCCPGYYSTVPSIENSMCVQMKSGQRYPKYHRDGVCVDVTECDPVPTKPPLTPSTHPHSQSHLSLMTSESSSSSSTPWKPTTASARSKKSLYTGSLNVKSSRGVATQSSLSAKVITDLESTVFSRVANSEQTASASPSEGIQQKATTLPNSATRGSTVESADSNANQSAKKDNGTLLYVGCGAVGFAVIFVIVVVMIIVIIRIRNRRHPRLDTQPICGDSESEVQIDGQTSEGKENDVSAGGHAHIEDRSNVLGHHNNTSDPVELGGMSASSFPPQDVETSSPGNLPPTTSDAAGVIQYVQHLPAIVKKKIGVAISISQQNGCYFSILGEMLGLTKEDIEELTVYVQNKGPVGEPFFRFLASRNPELTVDNFCQIVENLGRLDLSQDIGVWIRDYRNLAIVGCSHDPGGIVQSSTN